MEENEKKIVTDKLKPFWKEYCKAWKTFSEKTIEIEKRMTKKMDLGFDLEFFYCDDQCCGIGAEDYEKRDKFPPIHDSELNW